jgi:YidC/Oxa1 family membrane protein insertase
MEFQNIWQAIFIQPLANILVLLLHLLFNNLGLAIIGLTLVVRAVLVPLTLPSQKAMYKMRELTPEINKLKKRHKNDKTKLMQAQADLYKAHGVNPAAGCLPQIVQLLILFGLLGVFKIAISANTDTIAELNKLAYPFVSHLQTVVTKFLYLDLVHPDSFPVSGLPFKLPGVLLIASALVQLLSAKMMMPEVKKEQQVAKKTSGDMDDIMASTQQQMLYLFPFMTIIVGINFPSGLVLYWFVFSLTQMAQQYYTSGWGGLSSWLARLNLVQSGGKAK